MAQTIQNAKRFPEAISPIGEVLFALFEESNAVVGDEVGEVILVIIVSVTNFLPVEVDSVIVESGVSDEPDPLPPSGRYVRPVVLVQIFAKITWNKKTRQFDQRIRIPSALGKNHPSTLYSQDEIRMSKVAKIPYFCLKYFRSNCK